jgi:hypothetical protein
LVSGGGEMAGRRPEAIWQGLILEGDRAHWDPEGTTPEAAENKKEKGEGGGGDTNICWTMNKNTLKKETNINLQGSIRHWAFALASLLLGEP